MPERVLILRSDTLEKELEGILQDLRLRGQAVNIEIISLTLSSEAYRSEILQQANAKTGIDEFRRVVLFVERPAPSMEGDESEPDLKPDDLEVLTHLKEARWMARLILIQKGNSDAGDLWRAIGRRGSEIKPRYVFGRPHGRDIDAKYVRQVAQATLEPQDGVERGVRRTRESRLPPWLDRELAKKAVTVIGALGAIAGVIKAIMVVM